MKRLALIPLLIFTMLFAGCEPMEDYTDAQMEVFEQLEKGIWRVDYNESQGTYLRSMLFLEHYASPFKDNNMIMPEQHGEGLFSEPVVSQYSEKTFYYVSEDGKSLNVYNRNGSYMKNYSIITASDGTISLKDKNGTDVFYWYK